MKCNKAAAKSSRDHRNTRQQSKTPVVTSNSRPPTKTINGKQHDTVQVDVIYVAARHAKEVKNELESLGFLDKRYKMVKVVRRDASDDADTSVTTEDGKCAENLIAIPVTKQCVQQVSTETSSDLTSSTLPNHSFERLVVGRGTEMVPFSSSSMGKMKQRNGLR